MSIEQSGNLLLNELPQVLKTEILSVAQHLVLPNRTLLEERNCSPSHAYFITSGMASVVTEMEEGGSMEVTLIGCEGMTGGLSLLGSTAPVTRTFMQVPGNGYRVSMKIIGKLFLESEHFRSRVLRQVQQLNLTTNQLLGCVALHDIHPRLARWLLMVNDRTRGSAAPITHEFLSTMLGVQRPTVSVALKALQRAGLINYERGIIVISNREELVKAACECYPVTERLLKALY